MTVVLDTLLALSVAPRGLLALEGRCLPCLPSYQQNLRYHPIMPTVPWKMAMVAVERQGEVPRSHIPQPRIWKPTHADGGELPCPRNQAVAQVMEFIVC